MADLAEKVAEFMEITGADSQDAHRFLTMTESSVHDAVAAYFEAQDASGEEEELDSMAATSSELAPPARSAGGRTLGDEGSVPVHEPAGSSGSRSKASEKKKFGTIRDLQADGHNHSHDDDDSDKEQEFYAGGDKSGLAVQDPSSSGHRDQVQRLMNTAKRGGPRPQRADGGEDLPPQRNNFAGTGQSLGGDDVESRQIPAAAQRPPLEMVERVLHLWEDGFSIDDGDLYRYDDPANRRILDMINAGSAPMDLMNVRDGQAVDVKLDDHRGEKFVPPKKKYKPFTGTGQRLGSPAPGPAPSVNPTPVTSSASTAAAESFAPQLDDAQPVLSLQVRLADGTRLPARFNPAHTIGDVYGFVDGAAAAGRPYVLATTFPTRDLVDKGQILGDVPEFKRGGVLVQKWT